MNKLTLLALSSVIVAPTALAQSSRPASCPQVLKAKVNLNKASQAELTCLKAVKPAIAQDIIANRPFKDAADFAKKIEDIGKKLYELNKASVTF